jgi:hypothetical protein
MCENMQRVRSSPKRACGQQTVELACVLVILVVVLVPLINIGIIPLRFELARRAVGAIARKLSVSDKFSDAIKDVQEGSELSNALNGIGGVHLNSVDLVLSIISQKASGQEKTVDHPGEIPADWLPDGSQSPCNYFLHLKVHTDINPLMTSKLAGQSVPGLNKSLSLTIEEVAHWENLGRDPATGEFYVNE